MPCSCAHAEMEIQENDIKKCTVCGGGGGSGFSTHGKIPKMAHGNVVTVEELEKLIEIVKEQPASVTLDNNRYL